MWIRNIEKIKGKSKTVTALILTVVSIYFEIRYSKECSVGILQGLTFCVTVLVPSLFIFMVIASYVSSSKVSVIISKVFEKPTQKLLGLPKECASALLMSILGGYPIGAKCVSTLYKSGSISKNQAQKLSMIAVCSGPGFVLNYIGQALINNRQAGAILLISQLVGFFIIAIAFGKVIKVKDENVTAIKEYKKVSIVDAVSSGCNATINMCAMVIAFSALIAICDKVLYTYPALSDCVAMVLEVTTACNRMCLKYPLFVISFVAGFGGLSVHFQIFSILKDIEINKALFFLIRIIQGITSAVITYILVILFPTTAQVFSTVENATPTVSSSLWGAVALILTAVCFINSLSYTKIKRR